MSTSEQSFDFNDLTPIEIPIPIMGKAYILREADGEAAAKYKNACLKATKWDKTGAVTGMEGMADVEPLLVSLCLYQADSNGKLPLTNEGEPDKRFLVSLKKVKSWTSRVVKLLFNKAQEISDLKENKKEEEKTKSVTMNRAADYLERSIEDMEKSAEDLEKNLTPSESMTSGSD